MVKTNQVGDGATLQVRAAPSNLSPSLEHLGQAILAFESGQYHESAIRCRMAVENSWVRLFYRQFGRLPSVEEKKKKFDHPQVAQMIVPEVRYVLEGLWDELSGPVGSDTEVGAAHQGDVPVPIERKAAARWLYRTHWSLFHLEKQKAR